MACDLWIQPRPGAITRGCLGHSDTGLCCKSLWILAVPRDDQKFCRLWVLSGGVDGASESRLLSQMVWAPLRSLYGTLVPLFAGWGVSVSASPEAGRSASTPAAASLCLVSGAPQSLSSRKTQSLSNIDVARRFSKTCFPES